MSRKKTETVEAMAETPGDSAAMETEPTGAATEPLMYVGPTITGAAIQNRVYAEIPEGAAALIEKEAEIRNLFVPVKNYPVANRMLREGKGYIYRAYQKALAFRK